MILTELMEGLSGRQQKGRHDRALKDVVTSLVSEIINRRTERWKTAVYAGSRKEFLEGYPTVERFLAVLWEQEDFDLEINPLLDEIREAAFREYRKYVNALEY